VVFEIGRREEEITMFKEEGENTIVVALSSKAEARV